MQKADEAIAELDMHVATIDMVLAPGAECIYNDVFSEADAVCSKAENAVKALQLHVISAETSLEKEP